MFRLDGKIRWFEFFFPVFLGIFLWMSLTYIIYSGPPRKQLASRAERFLIERTLSATRWDLEDAGNIKSVTIDDATLHPQLEASEAEDRLLEHFSAALERVIVDEPRSVFIVSYPGLLAQQKAILDGLMLKYGSSLNSKVVLVYHSRERFLIEEEPEGDYLMRAFDSCGSGVAIACEFRFGQAKTAVQELAQMYWGVDGAKAPKFHLSRNLPFLREHFLLNLPSSSSLERLSAAQLQSLNGGFFKDQIVFIGSATSIENSHEVPPNERGLVELPPDGMEGQSVVSYHDFMAQVAEMFRMKQTVGVPPMLVTTTLLVLLCAMILALLWRIGALAALSIFIIYSVLYPFANDFGVFFFNVYIPMFSFVFGGFLTFLIASYGLLAFQAFKRWRLDAHERSLNNVAELRSNFISLVSHDLNTPLAKMMGLMDILWSHPNVESIRVQMLATRKDMARLQLCMRAVLMSARIEGGSLNEGAISLVNLISEFEDRSKPLLDKLGVRYSLTLDEQEDEGSMTPFTIDDRIVCYVMSCLMALVGSGLEDKSRLLILQASLDFRHLEVEEKDQRPCQLIFRVESVCNMSDYTKFLLFGIPNSFVPSSEDVFVEEAWAHLIHTFKNHYMGSLTLRNSNKGERVTLILSSFN